MTDDNDVDPVTKKPRQPLLGFSISAKRYVLYERNGEEITIINPKAHGLGHLYPPADSPEGWHDNHEAPKWIYHAWEYLLRKALNLEQIDLPWLGCPQMMREAVTTCNVLRSLHQWPGFRPFNFFMRPVLDPMHMNSGASLVAPLETDPRKWINAVCSNVADPSDDFEYKLSTNPMDLAQTPPRMIVRDFKELLSRYIRQPESKSLGPDGHSCTGRTVGLLQRAHIVADKIRRTGKETPRGIEEGDEPSEIMEFAPIEYEKAPEPKGIQKPSEYLILRIKKIGFPTLIRCGCSRRILRKICRRELVLVSTLNEYEQVVQEYKIERKK